MGSKCDVIANIDPFHFRCQDFFLVLNFAGRPSNYKFPFLTNFILISRRHTQTYTDFFSGRPDQKRGCYRFAINKKDLTDEIVASMGLWLTIGNGFYYFLLVFSFEIRVHGNTVNQQGHPFKGESREKTPLL